MTRRILNSKWHKPLTGFVCDRQVDGRIDKWPTKCPVPVPCHKAVDAFLTRHPEYSEFQRLNY